MFARLSSVATAFNLKRRPARSPRFRRGLLSLFAAASSLSQALPAQPAARGVEPVVIIGGAGRGDSTLVLVTVDHGGKEKSRGGTTMDEIEIPSIVHGPGVAAGRVVNILVNTDDTAATVAYVLGLSAPDCWIGKPVKGAFFK